MIKSLNIDIIKMKDLEKYKEKTKDIIKIVGESFKSPSQKTIIAIAVAIIFIAIIVGIVIIAKQQEIQKYVIYDGKNINESRYPKYKELIDELQEQHPDWTFTLFYTRLNWEEVISSEGHKDNVKYPLNLIPDSSNYPENWKCQIDRDKKFDNGTWLCASNRAIEHQMDPRNILNEENVFEFVELKYVEGAQTLEGLETITKDTFLDGTEIGKALIEAGKNENIDPYFIASRLIQEQGRKGTTLSKGYEYDENTIVYNPFNIGATGNSSEEILQNAAQYAFEQGWDSLEKAIIGGVKYVKEDYINKGQNTLYLQKFDVVNTDGTLYKNQYMQNLLAPESEAKSMKKIYQASDTVDTNLNIIIPLYENMPEESCEK